MGRALVIGALSGMLLLSAACPAAAQVVPDAPPRLALVIGNGAYQAPEPLPACPDSARAMAAALRGLDFEVIERTDATNGEMSADIQRLAERLAPGALAVVYFCGYARDFDGRVFLIPIGADLSGPYRILTEGIVAGALTGLMDRSDPRLGLAILDVAERPSAAGAGLRPRIALPPPSADLVTLVSTGPASSPPGALGERLAERLRVPAPDLAGVVAGIGAGDESPDRTVSVSALPAATVALGPQPEPPPAPPAAEGAKDATGSAPSETAENAPAASAASISAPAENAAAPKAEREPAPDFASRLSDADRRRIQERLRALGYYPGAIDGIFGRGTQAAIRRYQTEIGAEPTGRLTAPQAARLLSVPAGRT